MAVVVSPRVYNPRKTLFVGTVIFVLILVYIFRSPPDVEDAGPEGLIRFQGYTMGTYYNVQVAHADFTDAQVEALRHKVHDYLVEINRQMSTYIPDSEISQFNALETAVPFPVSPAFAEVTRAALYWAEATGGAFDPTLDPLINLWGFGHEAREMIAWPSEAEVEAALARTGFQDIAITDDSQLQKGRPEIELNLNAIAKGYAADGVLALLAEAGAENIYVEIGGDVAVLGHNILDMPWRIGIEQPVPEAMPGQFLEGIVHMSQGAMAGSGEYRRYFEDDEGQSYSHIIDPRTGYPARHQLASVNVWAETCMAADAAATALIVMGEEAGAEWIESRADLEAIFFVQTVEGDVHLFRSSGFDQRTGFQPISVEDAPEE